MKTLAVMATQSQDLEINSNEESPDDSHGNIYHNCDNDAVCMQFSQGNDCWECGRFCCYQCFLVPTYWPKLQEFRLYCKECYLSFTYHSFYSLTKLLYQSIFHRSNIELNIIMMITNYIWFQKDQNIYVDNELYQCKQPYTFDGIHSDYEPQLLSSVNEKDHSEIDILGNYSITCSNCYLYWEYSDVFVTGCKHRDTEFQEYTEQD